ncbi:ras-related protein Rab-34-like [Argiope bruennichi]|uniref:Ras-related protein Rab-36 n=1 Tax=Argiope bruennichi TaxID=94029 RepID=A0A8T0E6G0_ARGBR|nr:ras-related protein Rab-34-like [Argiope bruennichi]KAF8766967.1 Ras-related protein Rab-36 like protein [Argiope bruennichi]
MDRVYQSDIRSDVENSSFSSIPISKSLEERTLKDYPLPYDSNCTPNKETHFSYQVRTACRKINSSKCDALRLTKVIVVGDVAVGKTCLVRRFCVQAFETNYKATIGVDFEAEKFYILDVPYILQIWDTAGQEKFKCIASSYYRGARVVILVFDFSHISSLYNIPKWLDDTLKSTDNPFLFLVGTKKDMVTNSAYKLTENEAIKLAKAIGAEYCPVSSKTGENVDRLFRRIAVLTFCEDILKETTDHDEVKISENFVKFSKASTKKKKENCMSGCS